jgi:hypothetical protein
MTTLFLAALLGLAQAKDRPAQGAGAEPGQAAPAFKLKTPDGKTEVDVQALKGKPALLIFGSYT